MNYANEDQLVAVATSCEYFDAEDETYTMNKMDSTGTVSCEMCTNWNGDECIIEVFDDVLTSLDQT